MATTASQSPMPYAELKRYVISTAASRATRPEVSAIVLTGEAYV